MLDEYNGEPGKLSLTYRELSMDTQRERRVYGHTQEQCYSQTHRLNIALIVLVHCSCLLQLESVAHSKACLNRHGLYCDSEESIDVKGFAKMSLPTLSLCLYV